MLLHHRILLASYSSLPSTAPPPPHPPPSSAHPVFCTASPSHPAHLRSPTSRCPSPSTTPTPRRCRSSSRSTASSCRRGKRGHGERGVRERTGPQGLQHRAGTIRARRRPGGQHGFREEQRAPRGLPQGWAPGVFAHQQVQRRQVVVA
jgi:hypothetical protein